jgi:hypothetical protein
MIMNMCSPESQEYGKFTEQLYDSTRNAIADIDSAVIRAGLENKHVLVQVGGNWCSWCIRLHRFIESHNQIDSIIAADYILTRIHYSKDNKNPEAMEQLGFPNRFGFPVLVILNGRGERLHIQDTWYLEQEGGYSEEKIKRFLLNWNMKSVSPETYTDVE